MRYRIAVEDMEPGHWVAWALDLPGCFGRASTVDEAAASAPRAIADYFQWLGRHDPALPCPSAFPTVEVVEVFGSFRRPEDPDYIVNALFAADRRPLAYWDVAVALELLLWSRKDLVAVIESLPCGALQEPLRGHGGTIAGVLEHVAVAEDWYLSRLGMTAGGTQVRGDVLEKLRGVRDHARAQLPRLIGDDRIVENRGELWSGRKLVRRMLWHERAHTAQIARLWKGQAPGA